LREVGNRRHRTLRAEETIALPWPFSVQTQARLEDGMKPMLAAALAATLGASLGLGACAYNEALGRNQLLLVDNSALASAAEQAWAQQLASGKVSRDAAATARVRAVGQRLVQAAGLADRPWQYVVFDDPTANAFVLPGGQVGVNTGLLAIVDNDDQLAAVLGHEIAHMVLNHAAERYSQTAATQLGLGIAQSALGGGAGSERAQTIASLGGIGAQLGVLLPFSRRHELEADRVGVDYMARAGYRPSQALQLWRNMAAGRTGAGGAGGAGGFTSTHPSDAERLAALEAHIRAQGYS
jgi:predicted Zn-dependent protease